jgi:hypothetical protein
LLTAAQLKQFQLQTKKLVDALFKMVTEAVAVCDESEKIILFLFFLSFFYFLLFLSLFFFISIFSFHFLPFPFFFFSFFFFHSDQLRKLHDTERGELVKIRGDIPTEFAKEHDVIQTQVAKLLSQASQFAELFNRAEDLASAEQVGVAIVTEDEKPSVQISISDTKIIDNNELFDDEEELIHYTELPDLVEMDVPPALLFLDRGKGGGGGGGGGEKGGGGGGGEKGGGGGGDAKPSKGTSEQQQPSTISPSGQQPSDQQSIQQLLNRLSVCTRREVVDRVAADFCYKNNKANRKKLVLTLIQFPRARYDLLPFFGRLIAVCVCVCF